MYSRIEEGLGLLAEHIAALAEDRSVLLSAGRRRSIEIVQGLAEEEAAKVLVLLDAVRMGRRDQGAFSAHLRKFNSHLARGIYATVSGYRPADFREVREAVESLRRSHYLDGPNDVDWIFRNEIEARREERLYVDFVSTDDGLMWLSPARWDEIGPWPESLVCELISAMKRAGLMTERGLRATADAWSGVEVEEDTHWQAIAAVNRQVLESMIDDVQIGEASPRDLRLIIDHWTFPMHQLDMSKLDVPEPELRAEQRRWLDAQYDSW